MIRYSSLQQLTKPSESPRSSRTRGIVSTASPLLRMRHRVSTDRLLRPRRDRRKLGVSYEVFLVAGNLIQRRASCLIEPNSLLVQRSTNISNRNSPFVLHDRTPWTDLRDDNQRVHSRKRRRLLFLRKRHVSLSYLRIEPTSLPSGDVEHQMELRMRAC